MSETPGAPREELKIPNPVRDEQEPSQEEVLKSLESTVEEELSPEVVEKIMEKVQDINATGIAFSGLGELDSNNLGSLFKNGLLGDNWKSHDVPHEKYLKNLPTEEKVKKWTERTKESKDTIVHFNITGRMEESRIWEENKGKVPFVYRGRKIKSQIDLSQWSASENGVTILFDVSSFKEQPNTRGHDGQHGSVGRAKTYRADDPTGEINMPESEYGFIASSRVAPRYFRGIMMTLNEQRPEYIDGYVAALICRYENPEDEENQRKALASTREYYKDNEDLIKSVIQSNREDLERRSMGDETDLEKIRANVKEMAKIMEETYKKDPSMCFPVYSRAGDLLWPLPAEYKEKGFMPYENVKKLVEERDKNKKEK